MANYNPDADPADFDPTDPEVVDGFLNDPGNQQMWDALAEDFKRQPPADKVEELGKMLANRMRSRDEMASDLDGVSDDAPHKESLNELFSAQERSIHQIAEWIVRLGRVSKG